MFNMNPEIVCNIILKAREFFAKEEVVIPEEPEEIDEYSDDWYFEVLIDYQHDLTLQELKSIINELEPDQQAELVTLLWIGREDYDVGEWEEAFAEAKRNWNKRTAEYLLSKPLLADYLENALDQLGYSCNE